MSFISMDSSSNFRSFSCSKAQHLLLPLNQRTLQNAPQVTCHQDIRLKLVQGQKSAGHGPPPPWQVTHPGDGALNGSSHWRGLSTRPPVTETATSAFSGSPCPGPCAGRQISTWAGASAFSCLYQDAPPLLLGEAVLLALFPGRVGRAIRIGSSLFGSWDTTWEPGRWPGPIFLGGSGGL